MHNKSSIGQDGFKQVYAVNMSKQKTKAPKPGAPGRNRVQDKAAIKEKLPAGQTKPPAAKSKAPAGPQKGATAPAAAKKPGEPMKLAN